MAPFFIIFDLLNILLISINDYDNTVYNEPRTNPPKVEIIMIQTKIIVMI